MAFARGVWGTRLPHSFRFCCSLFAERWVKLNSATAQPAHGRHARGHVPHSTRWGAHAAHPRVSRLCLLSLSVCGTSRVRCLSRPSRAVQPRSGSRPPVRWLLAAANQALCTSRPSAAPCVAPQSPETACQIIAACCGWLLDRLAPGDTRMCRLCTMCTPPRAVGHVAARAARGLAARWPEFERSENGEQQSRKECGSHGVPQTRRASTPKGAGLYIHSFVS